MNSDEHVDIDRTLDALKARFAGPEGAQVLLGQLQRQTLLRGQPDATREVCERGELVGYRPMEALVEQGGTATDVYFLLLGTTEVILNGRRVALRGPGVCIGEMAALDPAETRSATIRALDRVVALRLGSAAFREILDRNPTMYGELALMIAARLRERTAHYLRPNPRPVVFLGSSTNDKDVVEAIVQGLAGDELELRPWYRGVFEPSSFTLETLLREAKEADFAVLVARSGDATGKDGSLASAVRDNVVFELGLFMSSLGRQRAWIVTQEGVDLKLPSDLQGVTELRLPSVGVGDRPDVSSVIDGIGKQIKSQGVKLRMADC